VRRKSAVTELDIKINIPVLIGVISGYNSFRKKKINQQTKECVMLTDKQKQVFNMLKTNAGKTVSLIQISRSINPNELPDFNHAAWALPSIKSLVSVGLAVRDGVGYRWSGKELPTSAPKPTAKPPAKPTAKPPAKPTAKPPAKPTAKPPAKPTAKPPAKPTTKGKGTSASKTRDKVKMDHVPNPVDSKIKAAIKAEKDWPKLLGKECNVFRRGVLCQGIILGLWKSTLLLEYYHPETGEATMNRAEVVPFLKGMHDHETMPYNKVRAYFLPSMKAAGTLKKVKGKIDIPALAK
jgi:hypothetical protein